MKIKPVAKLLRERLCVMTDEEIGCIFEPLQNREWVEDDYYNCKASITMEEWYEAVLAEVTARAL